MRTLELARLTYGLTQLAFPHMVTRLTREPEESGVIVATRVLGARDVVQALITMNAGPGLARLGGIVDALHLASALVFAVVHPSARRQALVSATVAAAFSAGELL
jgi:hypothetical protein